MDGPGVDEPVDENCDRAVCGRELDFERECRRGGGGAKGLGLSEANEGCRLGPRLGGPAIDRAGGNATRRGGNTAG
jgi:hypothetical protein